MPQPPGFAAASEHRPRQPGEGLAAAATSAWWGFWTAPSPGDAHLRSSKELAQQGLGVQPAGPVRLGPAGRRSQWSADSSLECRASQHELLDRWNVVITAVEWLTERENNTVATWLSHSQFGIERTPPLVCRCSEPIRTPLNCRIKQHVSCCSPARWLRQRRPLPSRQRPMPLPRSRQAGYASQLAQAPAQAFLDR